MRKSVFLLLLFVLPLYMLLQAQEKMVPFWGKQEVYLINQTEKTFHLVDALLKHWLVKRHYNYWMVYFMIRVWMVAELSPDSWNLVWACFWKICRNHW